MEVFPSALRQSDVFFIFFVIENVYRIYVDQNLINCVFC